MERDGQETTLELLANVSGGREQRARAASTGRPPLLHFLISFSLLSPLLSLRQNTIYQRYPRIHEFDCMVGPISDEAAAAPLGTPPHHRSRARADPPAPPAPPAPTPTPPPALSVQVPDLTAPGWVYGGTHTLADLPPRVGDMADPVGGAPWPTAGGAGAGAFRPHPHPRPAPPPAPSGPVTAHAWVRAFKADAGYGAYDTSYTLYVSADGTNTPLRLVARGQNLWSEGHFDSTTAEYLGWDPSPAFADAGGGGGGGADSVTFAIPPDCPARAPGGNEEEGGPGTPVRPPAAALGGLPLPTPATLLSAALPNPHAGASAAYDAWLHAAPHRRTRSPAEYAARAAAFEGAAARVAAHNAKPGVSYTLALNHLADWMPHELPGNRLAAPASSSPTNLPGGPRPGDAWHAPTPGFDPASLPTTLDWRGSPADSPVKDQAMCGSCWAFGTIGGLEAAVWRATGSAVLLSEQQLVDCAWSPRSYAGKSPNAGCFGGFQTSAYEWLFAQGAAASEAAYPYRGVNGLCDSDAPAAVRFKGKYVWVGGGDDGLREALLTKGPMTVSVDAAADDFALYRSGIYNNTACATRLKRLDHAVLISGYGRDPATGQAYWLVKNTWSRLWGEGGYIRIAAQPDGCGITAQPLYLELTGVVVAKEGGEEGVADA